MSEDLMPCGQCGQPHARCSAHTRAGRPCGQKRMNGQTVCKMHGGLAPQNLAAAERRRQERAAVTALESFGVPVEVDPHTALLTELHRTAGAVEWLGAIVGDLDRDNITWGLTKIKTGGDDGGVTEESRPNIWYELWSRERKHLVEVAKACVVAGIEERRIRLEERDARLVVANFEAAVVEVGLSDDQALALKIAFARKFLPAEAVTSRG